jgi:hypothetical protein
MFDLPTFPDLTMPTLQPFAQNIWTAIDADGRNLQRLRHLFAMTVNA